MTKLTPKATAKKPVKTSAPKKESAKAPKAKVPKTSEDTMTKPPVKQKTVSKPTEKKVVNEPKLKVHHPKEPAKVEDLPKTAAKMRLDTAKEKVSISAPDRVTMQIGGRRTKTDAPRSTTQRFKTI